MAVKLKSCENCRAAKAKCVPSPDASVEECIRRVDFHDIRRYSLTHHLGASNTTRSAYMKILSHGRSEESKLIRKSCPCLLWLAKCLSSSRVADVEKKLDDIYSLIQTSTASSTGPSNGSIPDEIPASATTRSRPTASLRSSGSPFALQNPGTAPASTNLEQCRAHKHRDRDAIDKDILTEKEAEELLRVYRVASQDFPFVYISPEETLDTLRHDKPFLLLSIMTMSSQRARSLQVLLEKELRETLASKVIIEGELSLDVLQGLMIYLAWYHHNFRPCRQQIYQLTQLCGAMVVDLELHKPADIEPGFVLHPSKACMACKKDTAAQTSSRVEAIRTYVGAYFLTTM